MTTIPTVPSSRRRSEEAREGSKISVELPCVARGIMYMHRGGELTPEFSAAYTLRFAWRSKKETEKGRIV
jgi:hypothetical protein